MVQELEIKPINHVTSLQELVICGGSFTYRLIRDLRTPLFFLGFWSYKIWCGVFGYEGFVIHILHGKMEINVLEILLNAAAFSYMFLKLHRIDKKVDVLETRIDFMIEARGKKQVK
jgi:hypothetical protein